MQEHRCVYASSSRHIQRYFEMDPSVQSRVPWAYTTDKSYILELLGDSQNLNLLKKDSHNDALPNLYLNDYPYKFTIIVNISPLQKS